MHTGRVTADEGKDLARDLARLCQAARRAPVDSPALVVAFVRGVLSRGPIEPEVLLDMLDQVGIDEHRWKAAAEAFAPPAWTQRAARRVVRSGWLSRWRAR